MSEQPKKIIEDIRKLDNIGRDELFDQNLEKLQAYTKDTFQSINQTVLNDMLEALTFTFCANYVNLEGFLSLNNTSPFSKEICTKTEWIIKLFIEYFQNPRLRLVDLRIIHSINTGSLTMDCVCRNFMWFVAYLAYYNQYVDAGLVTKNIRSDFKNKYYRYYKRRLPSLNPRIETIIKGGVRKIDPDKELPVYALGALLCDIGKMANIDLYDGEEPISDDKQKLHVLVGFNMLVKSKQYSFPVLAMTAFHHEYYGGKKSYNFTNSIISKLFHRERTDANLLNFISFEAKDFIAGSAFAFSAPKFLEIANVYTELTAKGNTSTLEVLSIMKREYIAHSLQLDPIFFEIFVEFMSKCDLINNAERAQIDGIIY